MYIESGIFAVCVIVCVALRTCVLRSRILRSRILRPCILRSRIRAPTSCVPMPHSCASHYALPRVLRYRVLCSTCPALRSCASHSCVASRRLALSYIPASHACAPTSCVLDYLHLFFLHTCVIPASSIPESSIRVLHSYCVLHSCVLHIKCFSSTSSKAPHKQHQTSSVQQPDDRPLGACSLLWIEESLYLASFPLLFVSLVSSHFARLASQVFSLLLGFKN